MKSARYFQVDAFTHHLFSGNPAGVCLLEAWPDEALLQRMAAEHNLSETAFLVPARDGYHLRWFTPAVEVDLCGHATLASAHIVFTILKPADTAVTFTTRSGSLTVRRSGELMVMDFPARPATPIALPAGLAEGLGKTPREVLKSRDLLCIFETEDEVRALQPRMDILARQDALGIIASAPGQSADIVSRFFAPKAGIPEDPVTGSAHCTLIPYWSKKLGKKELIASQASPRGGELYCTDRGDRVLLAGYAMTYMEGMVRLG
jgi:predicted PhzF superfamily epimerase YddE/YHI9